MIIGFLGPAGTFTEEAATKISEDLRSFDSIVEVLEAVKVRDVDAGVVPIENSVEGSVGVTLDILAQEDCLKIIKEIILPIRQHLLVNPGAKLEDVKEVYSHSQALAQCRVYLEKLGIPTRAMLSTTAAAKAIKGKPERGAIGTSRAAEIYGLVIADYDVQDYPNNTTRFLCIGVNDHAYTGKDKTSIVFSLPDDHPGGLYELLGDFANFKVNLTKIESRPSKEGLGSYIFFLDFEGHREEETIRNVLNSIKSKVGYVKILGSYPREGDD
ncbi:MAG TPA: prephenate dehydratase [Methanobacteriaceae archaeon]|jgi:prephenate dehydratase|nr:prephenate dehydratase [Euryarchaeota archaeon]HNR26386.1 prephenate dehydratase [Methanobacteriaceae archaeon]HNS24540.1 prephenate dehydratase [Methanobacteriaceae archaeon]